MHPPRAHRPRTGVPPCGPPCSRRGFGRHIFRKRLVRWIINCYSMAADYSAGAQLATGPRSRRSSRPPRCLRNLGTRFRGRRWVTILYSADHVQQRAAHLKNFSHSTSFRVPPTHHFGSLDPRTRIISESRAICKSWAAPLSTHCTAPFGIRTRIFRGSPGSQLGCSCAGSPRTRWSTPPSLCLGSTVHYSAFAASFADFYCYYYYL